MARRPNPDSWQYLLRFFPLGYKPIKEFKPWLEQNKPRFWLDEARRLVRYVIDPHHKEINAHDIPATVQTELVPELVDHLRRINNWYKAAHKKRVEYMRQVEIRRRSIPTGELERLRAQYGLLTYEESYSHPNYQEIVDRLNWARMDTLPKIDKWLAMKRAERLAWLDRTEYLKRLFDEIGQAARRKIEEEAEREAREKREREERERERRNGYSSAIWELYLSLSDKSGSYRTLGISPGATSEQIKAAYRRKAKEVYPDHGGTAEAFKAVQQAYEKLKGVVSL